MKTQWILVAMVAVLAAPLVAAAEQAAAGPSMLEQANQASQIERQRTTARVHELLGRAQELVKANEWADADLAVGSAGRLVAGGRELPAEERSALKAEVTTAADDLAARRAAFERQKAEAASKETARREDQRRMSEELSAQRQASSHWARLDEFRDQRAYDSALAEAQALLEKNPSDRQARRASEELSYRLATAQGIETRITRHTEGQASLAAVEESAVPYADILRYPKPKDWQELTYKRLSQVARERGLTESSVRAMGQLNTRVDLNMDNVSLTNVITYLGEATRTLITVDPRIKDDTGKSPDDEMVTMHARNLTLERALQMVLPAEMGFRPEEDHLIVSSREKANPLRVASYPVQDLVTEIPDHGASAPHLSLSSALSSASAGSGGGGGTSMFPDTAPEEKPEAATGQKLIDMIKKFVTPSDPRVAAWDDAGGLASIEYFNGSLVVSQTDVGHRKVMELLNKF